MPVIERWSQNDYGRPFPEKALALSGQPVKLSPFTTLTFTDAQALRPGAELITEFPFQRVGGEMTNGVWRFPLEQRGALLPGNLSQLPAEHYAQFLQGLEGKTAGEATLPDWIKFDGTSSPMASREGMLNPRPRLTVYPDRVYPHSVPRLPHFDELAGGKSVTVESVSVTPHQVTMKLDPREGNWLDNGVYVDGNRVGPFDHFGGLARSDANSTINTATAKFTDGSQLSISDRSLSVVKDWGKPSGVGQWNPAVSSVFDSGAAAVTPLDRLSFKQVAELKPGTTFGFDKPFQELGGKLTDGVHQFPLRRGAGQFSHLAEEHYQQFLDSLRGRSLSEATLPDWAKVSEQNPGRVTFDHSIWIKERPISYTVRNADVPAAVVRPRTPPAILKRLTGGETLTVTDAKLTSNEIKLVTDNELKLGESGQTEWMDQSVYVNGKRVGSFDPRGGIDRHEFPLNVTTADLKLSNGRTLSVAQRPLRVVEDWGTMKDGGFVPKYKNVLATKPVAVSPWEALSFEGASKVQAGDTYAQRYPFQWVDNKLTNGNISLPKVRPEGAQWRQYPISAVPASYYDSYLHSLEGKIVDDVVASQPRILSGIKTERELARTAGRALTARQSEMWDGMLTNGEKVPYVSLSDGVIFPYKTEGGNMLYVVDNPRSGAVYLYKDYADAEKLATNYHTLEDAVEGKGARTLARESGAQFIIHKGDWKEKLSQAIAQMSRQVDHAASVEPVLRALSR